MVIKVFFDVEYTDAALDQQRTQQQQSGQELSPRKYHGQTSIPSISLGPIN